MSEELYQPSFVTVSTPSDDSDEDVELGTDIFYLQYTSQTKAKAKAKAKLNAKADPNSKKAPRSGYYQHRCEECDKLFSYGYVLKQHIKVKHEGIRPFKCQPCDKSFATKRHLKDHNLSIHVNECERPFPCPLCDKRLATASSLRQHMDMHEPDSSAIKATTSTVTTNMSKSNLNNRRKHKCEQCSKLFVRLSDLRRHKNEIHNDNAPKFKCDDCGKEFARSAFLSVHRKLHDPTAQLPTCLICNKSFLTPASLHAHRLAHSDDRPFVCGECDDGFKSMIRLRVHMLRHLREMAVPVQYQDASSKDIAEGGVSAIRANPLAVRKQKNSEKSAIPKEGRESKRKRQKLKVNSDNESIDSEDLVDDDEEDLNNHYHDSDNGDNNDDDEDVKNPSNETTGADKDENTKENMLNNQEDKEISTVNNDYEMKENSINANVEVNSQNNRVLNDYNNVTACNDLFTGMRTHNTSKYAKSNHNNVVEIVRVSDQGGISDYVEPDGEIIELESVDSREGEGATRMEAIGEDGTAIPCFVYDVEFDNMDNKFLLISN